MNTPSSSTESNGAPPTASHGPFTACTSSPVHVGRSLREFEEQMATLRKENFNLKLRIYFLEEKPSSSSTSNVPAEATQKQLIDLKVSLGCSFYCSRCIDINLSRSICSGGLILNLNSTEYGKTSIFRRWRTNRCGKSSRRSRICSVKHRRRWRW